DSYLDHCSAVTSNGRHQHVIVNVNIAAMHATAFCFSRNRRMVWPACQPIMMRPKAAIITSFTLSPLSGMNYRNEVDLSVVIRSIWLVVDAVIVVYTPVSTIIVQ